jgi:hypothetical protein
MIRRRLVVGALTPLAVVVALTGTSATAWASAPPAPKPHLPAISAAQCTAQHGTVAQTKSKKKGTLKKRCQGGTLNGRTVAP